MLWTKPIPRSAESLNAVLRLGSTEISPRAEVNVLVVRRLRESWRSPPSVELQLFAIGDLLIDSGYMDFRQ